MHRTLETIVKDYGWAHTSMGLLGNTLFFIGSVLFLPAFETWKTFGVWLFILGSFLMLIGAVGELGVKIVEAKE